MIVYRNMAPQDRWGDVLANTGFEHGRIEPQWVWVAMGNQKPLAVILACPMHSLVYLMVVRAHVPFGKRVLLGLFRKCIRDCRNRGFKAFWMHLDPEKPERRFIKIVRRMGGKQHIDPQIMLSCELGLAARY